MTEIVKAKDFIREAGHFFVLSMNGDYPAGRPFGAIMEDGGKLYFATNDHNEAHKQFRANGHVQILAMKECKWARVTGDVAEVHDISMKEKMMEENPMLKNMHKTASSEHYLLFEVDVKSVEFK